MARTSRKCCVKRTSGSDTLRYLQALPKRLVAWRGRCCLLSLALLLVVTPGLSVAFGAGAVHEASEAGMAMRLPLSALLEPGVRHSAMQHASQLPQRSDEGFILPAAPSLALMAWLQQRVLLAWRALHKQQQRVLQRKWQLEGG